MENWTHARAVAFQSYAQRTITALGTVDAGAVAEAAWHMHREQRMGAHVFVIGNGGSFSTAEHIAADLSRSGGVKGVRGPGYLDWITGQANDFGYEQTFARHEVSTAQELDGGWFNAGGLNADDEVVVSGAQLLLSEELKYQIRNENED